MATNNPRLAIEITAMTDGLKKGLAEARAELKKFATEAGKSDYKTVLQQEKVAQAQARTEATQYRTEIAKLALEKKRGAQSLLEPEQLFLVVVLFYNLIYRLL